jgi:hypothetical protein
MVAPGGIPWNNKIGDVKVTTGSARSKKFEEAKEKLNWVEE